MSIIKDSDYIRAVCKIGHGRICCAYLVVGGRGFECMKDNASSKALIDSRRKSMTAQGDNCDGYETQ